MSVSAIIEIRVRLDDGIYRSQGGGVTEVRKVFNFGPRNWLAAAKALRFIKEENVRCYGNIGSGRTWAVLTEGDRETDITADLSDFLCDIELVRAFGGKIVRPTAPKTGEQARAQAERRIAFEEEIRIVEARALETCAEMVACH